MESAAGVAISLAHPLPHSAHPSGHISGVLRFVSYSARVSACKFVALARQLDSTRLTTLALENKFHFLSFFIADILSCFYCVYTFKSIFPSALLIFFSGVFIFMHYPFITVFIWIQFLSVFAIHATKSEVHWVFAFPLLCSAEKFDYKTGRACVASYGLLS